MVSALDSGSSGLRALSFCQNWPARPVSLQRKRNNLKEYLLDNPSHCSGGVYIILEVCYIEGVVELLLPNARSGRSVLSNGKRPEFVPWPGTLCCVLGQDSLLSRCLS